MLQWIEEWKGLMAMGHTRKRSNDFGSLNDFGVFQV